MAVVSILLNVLSASWVWLYAQNDADSSIVCAENTFREQTIEAIRNVDRMAVVKSRLQRGEMDSRSISNENEKRNNRVEAMLRGEHEPGVNAYLR